MANWNPTDHPRDQRGRFSRFTSGGGGAGWIKALSEQIEQSRTRDEAGYQPGQWRVVTRDEEVATLAAEMYQGGMEHDPTLDPEWLRGVALEEADRAIGNQRRIALRNGEALIHSQVDGIGEDELQRVADMVDDLHTRYPAKGRIMVGIVPNDAVMSHDHAEAETVRGEGFIRIKAKSFDNEAAERFGFMPAADDHDRLDYVLAHEWGHAIDTHSGLDLMVLQFGESSHALSDYGQSSPREALAEAFAEWYLTKGHTTNAAAQEYAAKFNWGQPWQ
jgi:hypothetical protein